MRFVATGDWHVDKFSGQRQRNGIPIRTWDVLANVDYIVDFCINSEVDYLLITGDVYDKTKPHNTYRREVNRRLKRAANAGIKIFIVVGNHDMPVNRLMDHALSDLRDLQPENIVVVDNEGWFDLGDCNLFCLSWQLTGTYDENQFDLNKPTIAISHCSVPEVVFESGTSIGDAEIVAGKEFVVTLDFWQQFDLTVLGHIHKAQNWGNVVYPGSIEHLTWGEFNDGSTHGFVYGEVAAGMVNWWHHALPTRNRVDLKLHVDDPLPVIDPETMYRIQLWTDEVGYVFPTNYIHNHFKDAFELKLQLVAPKAALANDKRLKVLRTDMTPTEMVKATLEHMGEEFDADMEKLWLEIMQETM